MDYTPAYIIRQYLIEEALLILPGSSGTWPAYVSALPDGDGVADEAVGCMDTSPIKDGRKMSDGENLFHFGVQLLLRSTAYNTGWAKMETLLNALETVKRNTVTISGTDYRLDNITLATGIVDLGQEEGSKRRELFSLNFLVTLKEI